MEYGPARQSLLHRALLLVVVVVPLMGAIFGMVLLWNLYFSAKDLLIMATLYLLTGLGISIGYHRMLTHRSFEAPAPVRGTFLALGSMAMEGPAIEWAATHVKHHAKSDTEEDPHSPLEGFWHSHLGWLFRNRFVTRGVYTTRFYADPVAVFAQRTFWLWAGLGLVIPFVWGGLALDGSWSWSAAATGLLWGGIVRIGLLHHVTWSVNSVCHTFGRRPLVAKDRSSNVFLVGLLGFGEGWHNNHHAFPTSAFHGLRWWQVDLSGYLIRLMARLRLVRNVLRPRLEDLRAKTVKNVEMMRQEAERMAGEASRAVDRASVQSADPTSPRSHS